MKHFNPRSNHSDFICTNPSEPWPVTFDSAQPDNVRAEVHAQVDRLLAQLPPVGKSVRMMISIDALHTGQQGVIATAWYPDAPCPENTTNEFAQRLDTALAQIEVRLINADEGES